MLLNDHSCWRTSTLWTLRFRNASSDIFFFYILVVPRGFSRCSAPISRNVMPWCLTWKMDFKFLCLFVVLGKSSNNASPQVGVKAVSNFHWLKFPLVPSKRETCYCLLWGEILSRMSWPRPSPAPSETSISCCNEQLTGHDIKYPIVCEAPHLHFRPESSINLLLCRFSLSLSKDFQVSHENSCPEVLAWTFLDVNGLWCEIVREN